MCKGHQLAVPNERGHGEISAPLCPRSTGSDELRSTERSDEIGGVGTVLVYQPDYCSSFVRRAVQTIQRTRDSQCSGQLREQRLSSVPASLTPRRGRQPPSLTGREAAMSLGHSGICIKHGAQWSDTQPLRNMLYGPFGKPLPLHLAGEVPGVAVRRAVETWRHRRAVSHRGVSRTYRVRHPKAPRIRSLHARTTPSLHGLIQHSKPPSHAGGRRVWRGPGVKHENSWNARKDAH